MSEILAMLSLRAATLAQIQAQLRDDGGRERQPAPRKFVFYDQRGDQNAKGNVASRQTLEVWTGQEPGERLANTLLLCAIRDRAHQITLEPQAKGVKVRFQIENGVREQKLPTFALAPIVRHFKSLASDSRARHNNAATSPDHSGAAELCGQIAIAVDEQLFQISFSPFPTRWGAGVKVQFAACTPS